MSPASIGGIFYVVVAVGSILFGKRRDEVEAKVHPVVFRPGGPAAVATYGSEATLKLPGTILLVALFFTAFVLYYYINWKYLSEVWPLR